MEQMYGRGRPSMEGSVSDPTAAASEWSSPVPETGLEESMWQRLNLVGRDSYPERPGEPDCIYYLRTGFCGYGSRCRFNHPHDRSSVGGVSRGGGEYPERVGQPVCQFFMKTGTCKFGATCKYHHPRYGRGAASSVSLNYDGYPLRPGEKDCSYYAKTGQCKFGVTCKFHHPQPTGISVPAPAPAFYPTVQSPSAPSPTQYGGVASWQVARPPLITGSYVQGPYGTMMFSPGMVPIPGWSSYPATVSPVASPGAQHTIGAGSLYGLTPHLSPTASTYPGPYTPVSSAVGPSSSSQKVSQFPERPGQPECQFYLRTGDCKYGSTCRYHHPPQWSQPKTTCALSPIGLPLRPGAPPCSFYAQHGMCKFGPTCKFDHPMGISYSPSASSLADMPVAPYPVGISMAKLAPSSSSSELRSEFIAGSSKDSFSTRMPSSSDNTSSVTVGSIFSKSGGSVSQPHVQLSGQSSASPGSSSSIGHGSESLGSS